MALELRGFGFVRVETRREAVDSLESKVCVSMFADGWRCGKKTTCGVLLCPNQRQPAERKKKPFRR